MPQIRHLRHCGRGVDLEIHNLPYLEAAKVSSHLSMIASSRRLNLTDGRAINAHLILSPDAMSRILRLLRTIARSHVTVLSASATASTLATAIEDNVCAYAAAFGRTPHAEMCDQSYVLWVITRIPTLPFTGILRPYPANGQIAPTVNAIMRSFQQRNARPSWIFNPTRVAPDIAHHLAQYQLRQTADIPAMAINLEAIHVVHPPHRMQIAPVTDTAALAAWAHVYTLSNGAPDWIQQELYTLFAALTPWTNDQLQLYLAYQDDQPVATAATFRAAGVVGLYEVATLPEVRRRGIGTAVTQHTLVAARQDGVDVATLLSSPMAVQLYHQLGFQEYCRLQIYN